MAIYQNITQLVGNTPIIKLNNIVPEGAADVYVKLEAFNPGSSVKDRIALAMIEDAEKAGTIKPGDTIVEPTSGNTGIGLAWVGAAKGYKVIIVMPETMSIERRKIIQAYGADLVLTPGSEGMKGAIAKAQEIAKEKNGWVPFQFANPSNPKIHEDTTGPEIWEQTEGKITHLIACTGTGGTLSGSAKFLKEKNPNIKIIGVDASGSILKGFHETGSINKDEIHPYQIEGMGKNLIPSALLFDKVDEFVRVNDEMSAYRTREIALKEAIMGGYTTGAVTQGLLQYANSHEFSKDDLVVAIFPDHGSRYITKVYSDQWMEEQGFINNCVHNYDEVFKTEIIK